MTASKQAIDILKNVIGHDGFKVKSCAKEWNYREEQECEYLNLNVCGEPAKAVVMLDKAEVMIQFASNVGEARCKAAHELLQKGLAEARAANHRMTACAIDRGEGETPTYIRRVFLFETENGLDWGVNPEEFGHIEPFLSVSVMV